MDSIYCNIQISILSPHVSFYLTSSAGVIAMIPMRAFDIIWYVYPRHVAMHVWYDMIWYDTCIYIYMIYIHVYEYPHVMYMQWCAWAMHHYTWYAYEIWCAETAANMSMMLKMIWILCSWPNHDAHPCAWSWHHIRIHVAHHREKWSGLLYKNKYVNFANVLQLTYY